MNIDDEKKIQRHTSNLMRAIYNVIKIDYKDEELYKKILLILAKICKNKGVIIINKSKDLTIIKYGLKWFDIYRMLIAMYDKLNGEYNQEDKILLYISLITEDTFGKNNDYKKILYFISRICHIEANKYFDDIYDDRKMNYGLKWFSVYRMLMIMCNSFIEDFYNGRILSENPGWQTIVAYLNQNYFENENGELVPVHWM